MERMDIQEKLDRLEINYDYLKEENRKLKEENKKLKERIERWEKCFKKGGFNPQDVECLMEEDTLQELRDLGEI